MSDASKDQQFPPFLRSSAQYPARKIPEESLLSCMELALKRYESGL
eukprot:CAMPEP_0116870692 /NCGR_PEP_ID=MMETSP0463-20121206/705_1 /TAXON_ID=181622 /ORGANISM="Strombidinopsis sp, Strain SopsisLIS2011" /LENGTH=45 /DNA_ID= /DNA_START= /DNA_END= /DNA_ORIENTATION=